MTSYRNFAQMKSEVSAQQSDLVHEPLVTIIVPTYNSGETVQQTLDSIVGQAYCDIELVICDDSSRDNTLQVVESWMCCHEARFVRVLMLRGPANQGLCRNLATGFANARGEWVKVIAGDDLLLPNAIQSLVNMAVKHSHAAIASLIVPFASGEAADADHGAVRPTTEDMRTIAGGGEAMLSAMYWRNLIPAPGVLINRAAYEEVGGIDLAFTHLEDWPLWINLLRRDKTIGLSPEALVAYRVASNSLSTGRLATTMSRPYLDDLLLFYRKYQRADLSLLRRLDRSIEMLRLRLARGPLRDWPRLYRCTRLLHAFSPIAWRRPVRGP